MRRGGPALQAHAACAPTDPVSMNSAQEKLTVLEKLGYSLGDLAANLIFQTLVTFLAFFYTDVFRIPAGTAATIIFAVGLLGAFVFTPVMGLVADRTRTRWGKFRPWVLWTAVPFGVLSLLAFTTPDLGEHGKVSYALATYTLLVLVYVANNLPYSALSGVLTGSMEQRNSLSSWRFVAVMVAQFIIQVLLLPLVLLLGHGDKAHGFHVVMTAFAVIGTVFFLVTFFTTRERVAPVQQRASSIREDLADLARNRPWQIMLLVTILVFVNLALKGGMYVYYFKYYMDGAALADFLDRIGFEHVVAGLDRLLRGLGLGGFQWPQDAATSTFSLFNALGIIFMIVGIGCSKRLADRYGKRNVFGGALLASTLFLLAFEAYPPGAVGLVVVSYIFHGFFYGITTPLLWAMIADVADYSEWKNRRRATAMIFSAMLCGLKLGLSLGGALVAGILAHYGYRPDAPAQDPAVVDGIRLTVSVFCSVPFLLAVALLFLYEIDKPMESRIERELDTRRLAGEGA
jgi:Na+/melibiose symporter-like transporter